MIEIYGIEEIYENVNTIREFKLKHPNAQIHEVDGKGVIGMCEACGEPIIEGEDDYVIYADGVVTHKKDCSKSITPARKSRGLSREARR